MKSKTKKELIQFFIFTCLFSWVIWLPGVLAFFGLVDLPEGLLKLLELLGATGPAIIALILVGRNKGRTGITAMLKSAFNIKKQWKFWLSASVFLLLLHGMARLTLTMISADYPSSNPVPFISLLPLFIIMFLVGGGLGEEIGWRGYALDRLQEKYNALTASLLLASVWILWHLPLFFYGGTNQSLIPFWLFILPVIPLGIMLTWVYNNTKTIFAAAFFHTAGNIAHEIFRVLPTETSSALTGMFILTGFYFIAAFLILLIYGPKGLTKSKTTTLVNND